MRTSPKIVATAATSTTPHALREIFHPSAAVLTSYLGGTAENSQGNVGIGYGEEDGTVLGGVVDLVGCDFDDGGDEEDDGDEGGDLEGEEDSGAGNEGRGGHVGRCAGYGDGWGGGDVEDGFD